MQETAKKSRDILNSRKQRTRKIEQNLWEKSRGNPACW